MSEADLSAANIELDEEAKALQLEQAKAQSRKAIAESQRSALEARLPAMPKSPIEGKAEFGDKAGQLAEVAAFKALTHAAQLVAARIAEQTGERGVRIVNSDELWKSDYAYHRVDSGLNRYNTALEELSKTLGDARPRPSRCSKV
jgi:hypothetical protein